MSYPLPTRVNPDNQGNPDIAIEIYYIRTDNSMSSTTGEGVLTLKVRLFAFLMYEVGKRELDIQAPSDVASLLELMSRKYGTDFDKWIWRKDEGSGRTLITGTLIMVNGHHILHLKGLQTHLDDSDVVSIFPPAAGG